MLIVVPPPQVRSCGRGLREQHMGVILPRVGVYIQCAHFHLFQGGYGGGEGDGVMGEDRDRGWDPS